MSKESATTFKLLLIGNSNVGKSSFLLRFTDDTFLPPEETSATIGVDFKVKMLELEGKKYKLTIWDTAGQERFRTLTSSYYRGAQGVVLVYDVTNRDTFTSLDNWFEELDKYCPSKDVVKMIVGNKVDMDSTRVVSLQEGLNYAKKRQALFIECSAKTKLGVQQAIEELVQKIIDTPVLWQKQPTQSTVQVSDQYDSDSYYSSCPC
ncbi:hypothetical protein CONCODRAFT_77179 [Conidiobolus coronatus NRRL 28638]|uniref:small monomeric GTPase n=1 Tax=Conidiobolus coronatus (strain ATCC 28846 / CBS 209.66 / NRRL 28638) TaxID=796925 RepID=A0A137PFP4_CONC2|nr:hypothetical protein CONCODRAFT_77179 [Conidiobolus coronatus NRRL 28638]|eukprot:KXN73795.1 hypothetical protein CONCODRAFT_77179 [Conidiobolus coronatus NRRL 28638]